jgi:hypothetical protein
MVGCQQSCWLRVQVLLINVTQNSINVTDNYNYYTLIKDIHWSFTCLVIHLLLAYFNL